MPSRAVAVAVLLTVAAPLGADDKTAPPSREQIAAWVKQLADDDFDVREKASKHLWQAGRPTRAALEEAVKGGDAEVRRRAGDILEKFKLGIFADTPAKVVELIRLFRVAEGNARAGIVRDLLAQGVSGYQALQGLTDLEPAGEPRRLLQAQVLSEAPRFAGTLLLEGNHGLVEDLLLGGVNSDVPAAFPAYAAYWALRGRLDERLKEWQTRAPKEDEAARVARVLTSLFRAKGDPREALKYAGRANDPPLRAAALTEAGAWKELAAEGKDLLGLVEVEALGYQAAWHRLAGDTEAFHKDVAALEAHGKAQPETERWFAAEALLVNERPVEAARVLTGPKHAATALEIFFASDNLAAARTLTAALGNETDLDWGPVAARLHHRQGDTDRARRLLAALGQRIAAAADIAPYESIVDVEMRLGLRDEARAHAAALLGHPKMAERKTEPLLFGLLFPERGPLAAVWWRVLAARHPGEDVAARMKRLLPLMEGKVPADELRRLVRAAADAARSGKEDERAATLLALAESCRAAGLGDLEDTLLGEAGDTSEALRRRGDRRAEKQTWAEAATFYARASAADPRDPLSCFLRGEARARSGDEKEGKHLKEAAHLLPLGDEEVRHVFAEALAARGFVDDARREYEIVARTADAESWYAGRACEALADSAEAHGAFAVAADLRQRALLPLLRTNSGFLETGAYLVVTEAIRTLRARAFAAAGQAAEATREAEAALALRPLSSDAAGLVAAALDRLGKKSEADALFAKAFPAHVAFCKDHPRSAWGHNGLAWICASARRRLDDGLLHAAKAVELGPDTASYLDTLAEVHFQRGDTARAMALAQRCVALEPKNAFYRKQLRRREAGDPKADLPNP